MNDKPKKPEFEVPAGAVPFTPGSITEAEPKSAIKDGSNTVPGLDTSLPKVEENNAPETVKPDKQVNISLEEEDETKEVKDILTCPACGFKLDEDGIPEVSDEEKRRWLRHVLGEDRYTKTFELFDGALVVKFRNRTTEENDAIFEELARELDEGLMPAAVGYASPAYVSRMYRYMLTSSLVSIETFGLEKDSPAQLQTFPVITAATYPAVSDKDTRTPLARAHEHILDKMSEGKLTALLNAHRSFESLIGVLITRSEDPDFWRPAGENN